MVLFIIGCIEQNDKAVIIEGRSIINSGLNECFKITSEGKGTCFYSVDWGDGRNCYLTRNANSTVNIKHAYFDPGNYNIVVKTEFDNKKIIYTNKTIEVI